MCQCCKKCISCKVSNCQEFRVRVLAFDSVVQTCRSNVNKNFSPGLKLNARQISRKIILSRCKVWDGNVILGNVKTLF